MGLLELIPILLKILPFLGLGILVGLWRLAAYRLKKAKEEAATYKRSYELAGEIGQIEKQESKDVKAIEDLDINGIIDALRGILHNLSSKS